jgi:hypothetical protein
MRRTVVDLADMSGFSGFWTVDTQSTGAGRSAPRGKPLDEAEGSSPKGNDFRVSPLKRGGRLLVSNTAQ